MPPHALMSSPTFFHAALDSADAVIELSLSESTHASKSRRLQQGHVICLLNGRGLVAEGRILQNQGKQLLISVDNSRFVERPPKSLTIATAVPKVDRQRFMVDIMVQHGVNKIIPLHCTRSATRLNSKLHDKWCRYAIEACKQSQNPWLPEISQEYSVADVINWTNDQQNMAVFYAEESGEWLRNVVNQRDHLVALIGPEGGFSPGEFTQLENARLKPIKLATAILRTEAAAISAAAQCRNLHFAAGLG